MCGILGGYGQIADDTVLEAALLRLSRRGPDGGSSWQSQQEGHRVWLGHRRLSIIDLSERGTQPMHYEGLSLSFNGEIFNYQELRAELRGAGYQFDSDTDSEVLLKAWHHWGPDCLHRFNGMWAFALWSAPEQKLYLCRDRFGIKPLYYYQQAGALYFGSEIQALLGTQDSSPALHAPVLENIARSRFDWQGGTDTYIKDLHILPGGHLLSIGPDMQASVQQWYELRRVEVPADFETQAAALRELLFDACRLRMRSDVSIATCLSGGVDSTSISASLYELERQGSFEQFSHKAFCAAFPGTKIDESTKARSFANSIGVELDLLNITAPGADELEGIMEAYDGPAHALAFYPIWKLYERIASQGIKVTLDGQGPDEMLGGYHPVKAALRSAIRSGSWSRVQDVLDTYGAQKGKEGKELKDWKRSLLKEIGIDEAKNPLRKLLGKKVPLGERENPIARDAFDEDLFQQFFRAPLPAILQQYDRCSMGSSIECRMPFMDYRIVEFVFSLPSSSKVGNGYTKRVLRAAMQGISPDEIILDKRKIGFNAPIIDWFKGPLREWMGDQINSQDFISSPYFDGAAHKAAFERFLTADTPDWAQAWNLWGPVHVTWWLRKQAGH